MARNRPSISKEEFESVYEAEILGREFVEDIEYYKLSMQRFWECLRRIDALDLPEGTRALDIGGGITGVLMDRLLKFDVTVGDVNERARADIEAHGLGFITVDLFRDPEPAEPFDLVVLQEVIEHIPQPPYVVFRRIAQMMAPGGWFFLTTPNGHRFRNLVYMALGREILDIYRYPDADESVSLGHQHEYTLKQLIWQAGHAEFDIKEAEYYADGWQGATTTARVARVLSKPLDLIPHFQNSIAMMLRRPTV